MHLCNIEEASASNIPYFDHRFEIQSRSSTPSSFEAFHSNGYNPAVQYTSSYNYWKHSQVDVHFFRHLSGYKSSLWPPPPTPPPHPLASQFFSRLLPRCCWECSIWEGTIQQVLPVQNWNYNDWKLSPVARYLRINAKRSPGGIQFRIGVSFFCTEGPMMFNNSLNLRWGILIYSANPPESSMARSLKIV